MNKQLKPLNPFKVGGAIVGAIIILAIIISTVQIVPAGSTGVVLTFGKVSNRVMSEGLNFKIPFVQNVAVISNKIQKTEVEANAVSKDLQSVSSSIAVNYRINPDASAGIYRNIGRDYETVVLLPAVQESMKSISAKYTAEELITERAAVGEEIKTTLSDKVNSYGITIDKFNIVNFDFSAEFNQAIEAKQVAEQNLLKTKTEQEEQIVIAEAEAKKKTIAAEAQAKATLTTAEAEAQANQKIAASLTDSVVEYQKIQKWNGVLPYATGGTSILDIGGIAGGSAQ